MPSATLLEPSITERTFILQALSASHLRLDGRSPTQTRPLSIAFSPDPDQVGYAHVSLGSTQAIAQVSAQLGPPREDRPNEGLLVIQAEIDPIAGQEYEFGPGRQSDEEIVFEQRLDKAIKRTECVDREALCVIAGKKVWTVRISVHILADTGSILDCAVLACLTALRHFRKPETAIIDADTVHVFPLSERVGTPLAMAHHPACVSFSLFDLGSAESKAAMDAMKGITVASAAAAAAAAAASGKRAKGEDGEDPEDDEQDGNEGQRDPFASADAGPGSSAYPAAPTRIVCLADPTTIEEQLASSSLVFVLNAQREICMLDKAGGQPLPPDVLLAALKQAVTLVTEWTSAVDEALRRDAEWRVQGVY
ncbi:3'-5'-exoribonuclease [Tilletia horrida]|nr:3'-5'-exoribonuclease [Tilletia horrida]